jgi:iron complex transport system ATP-binding protein
LNELILDVCGLCASYDGDPVLQGISFSVPKGQFIGIAGPNGAGKSTLLRLLAGLMEPTAGEALLWTQPLTAYTRTYLAQQVAVIFHDFSCPYEFTVADLVAMGRNPFLGRWKSLSKQDHTIIQEAIELTDINHLRHRSLFDLSGGERQRAIIAKALAQQPSLLLLDEPSTHLDIHHQINVFNILRRLNREKGVTVLCITHDLTLAAQYVSRFLLLQQGILIADGPPMEIISRERIEKVFDAEVSVGLLSETSSLYVYPIGNK